jgi:hypothetical protein
MTPAEEDAALLLQIQELFFVLHDWFSIIIMGNLFVDNNDNGWE